MSVYCICESDNDISAVANTRDVTMGQFNNFVDGAYHFGVPN
jgi:hypothetical protein